MQYLTNTTLAIALLAVVVVSPGLADSLADDGAAVYLTVDEMAMVEFGATGLTLLDDPHGPYDLYGEIDLTVAANYRYYLGMHWLDSDYWERDSEFILWDISQYATHGLQQGRLALMVDTDTTTTPSTGDATGADASDNAGVTYGGEHKGTVQVTLYSW